MHHFHDGSVRAAHYTAHLLHEKNFWKMTAILAVIGGLFALLVFFGNDIQMQNYSIPYAPYY